MHGEKHILGELNLLREKIHMVMDVCRSYLVFRVWG